MSERQAVPTNPKRRALISPSLMCADQLRLGEEIRDLTELGVDWLHMDIMDGHYVPNLTFGTDQCTAIGAASTIPLDIHLMVDDPDRWAPVFSRCASSPFVSIHPETTWHPARTLAQLRESGARPGIAVDPAQDPGVYKNLFGIVDFVLLMTVNPGYSGQKLVPWAFDTIRRLKSLREESGATFLIEVDGNVSWANIPGMVESGADVLVAGTSSLFDPSLSRPDAMKKLHAMLTS